MKTSKILLVVILSIVFFSCSYTEDPIISRFISLQYKYVGVPEQIVFHDYDHRVRILIWGGRRMLVRWDGEKYSTVALWQEEQPSDLRKFVVEILDLDENILIENSLSTKDNLYGMESNIK